MNYAVDINKDIKEAMKAKDVDRLTVLRGIKTAFTNALVADGKTPQDIVDNDTALSVIKKQAKQRKDSIDQYTQGGREDLAEKEKEELKMIEAYLPETMSQDEIRPIAEKKKDELGITDKSRIGQLMGAVISEIKQVSIQTGKEADGSDVKAVVDSLFD